MTRFLCSVLSLLILAVPSAFSAECGGVALDDELELGGTKLVLNGLGIREATVFSVDVYVAGLYVETKSRNGGAIAKSEQTKRLELHFVRDVGREKIVDAWNEGFANCGRDVSALTDRITKLNGWMADMADGETLIFTYRPEEGLEVEVKGASKGTIAGADFAEAFLAIWLGPNPPNAGLKTGLLGGACG